MSIGGLIRDAVIAAFVAALVGGASIVIGLDAPHGIALACGVLALALILLTQRSVVPAADLEPPDLDPPVGGRRDVEQLAWSMVEHRTHIRGVVVLRAQRIAERRLAEHGIDAHRAEDHDAAARLLGAAAWAVLRPDRGERPVAPRELDAALRALESLPPPEPFRPDRSPSADRTSRAD